MRIKVKRDLIFEVIIIFAGIVLISLFYKYNILLIFLLFIGWLFLVRFWYKKHDIYFFLIGVIIGTVGEIIFVNFGVWKYTNPDFLGIPLWLPFAWGITVMLMKRIAESIVK